MTNTQDIDRALIIHHCEVYRKFGQFLCEQKERLFPFNTVVHVDAPSYHGQGLSDGRSDNCHPDQLPVRLCNGNQWYYPLDGITLVQKSQWEPWVKRMHRQRARQFSKVRAQK